LKIAESAMGERRNSKARRLLHPRRKKGVLAKLFSKTYGVNQMKRRAALEERGNWMKVRRELEEIEIENPTTSKFNYTTL